MSLARWAKREASAESLCGGTSDIEARSRAEIYSSDRKATAQRAVVLRLSSTHLSDEATARIIHKEKVNIKTYHKKKKKNGKGHTYAPRLSLTRRRPFPLAGRETR